VIRGVIVDFGGVLAQHPSDEALARLTAAAGLEAGTFAAAWLRYRHSYDLGHVSAAEYWSLVGGRGYSDDDLERLVVEDAACWAMPNEAMVDWLAAIKGVGIRVGLLSNAPREQWRRLVGGLAWLGCCDVVTVSYELGLGKPNPAIYRHCLGELGLPACDVLFVDDRSENIATANELGLHTALFTDVERLRDDLSARFGEELPLP
jgi:putative hydrolase of the HAD superfamily